MEIKATDYNDWWYFHTIFLRIALAQGGGNNEQQHEN